MTSSFTRLIQAGLSPPRLDVYPPSLWLADSLSDCLTVLLPGPLTLLLSCSLVLGLSGSRAATPNLAGLFVQIERRKQEREREQKPGEREEREDEKEDERQRQSQDQRWKAYT